MVIKFKIFGWFITISKTDLAKELSASVKRMRDLVDSKEARIKQPIIERSDYL
jgi:hypothetical protein